MRRSLAQVLTVALLFAGSLATTGAAGAAGAEPGNGRAPAAGQGLNSRYLCVQAHVAGIGWQAEKTCVGAVVGTTEEGRAIEALRFVPFNMSGLCARAHVATIGWQPWVCVRDNVTLEIGTTGQSLALEAVEVQTQSGSVVLNAHLSGYGWQGQRAGARVLVGTTGESRAIEALTAIG
ncbi:hypothetical protein ACIRBX_22725 [Kitasatospora sp. NPDC096147]|uniref:hypothetical protein n=1 Tax=Kitasatospora sp. NPDC096147 TaxID=3364093 RepID=UPI0037F3AEDE